MDISMDIHGKSVDMDMDMDMDGKFHIHGIQCTACETLHSLGHFTFWIILSLRPSLSPKYGLRPKISEKGSRFFRLVSAIAQRFTETKLRTQQLLRPNLIQTFRIAPYWFYMEEIR